MTDSEAKENEKLAEPKSLLGKAMFCLKNGDKENLAKMLIEMNMVLTGKKSASFKDEDELASDIQDLFDGIKKWGSFEKVFYLGHRDSRLIVGFDESKIPFVDINNTSDDLIVIEKWKTMLGEFEEIDKKKSSDVLLT